MNKKSLLRKKKNSQKYHKCDWFIALRESVNHKTEKQENTTGDHQRNYNIRLIQVVLTNDQNDANKNDIKCLKLKKKKRKYIWSGFWWTF